MALNLNNIMLGSEDSKKLADFYATVLGAPNPDWSDEAGGWFGFQAGDGSLAGEMLMCTFADPDGNYFQLATPWNPEST